MQDKDKILQEYIHKIYELQDGNNKKALTHIDLKKAADELGLTDNEFAEMQANFEAHHKKAVAHAAICNWESAYFEFQNAVALNPINLDAVFGFANAAYNMWLQNKTEDYREKTLELIERVQQISPGHQASIRLSNNLRINTQQTKTKKKTLITSVIVTVVILLIILFIVRTKTKATIAMEEEKVNAAWAQVENVYERRSQLLPELVKVVKAASNYEEETLNNLMKLNNEIVSSRKKFSEMNKDEFNEYTKKQAELGSLFKVFSAKNISLQATENYRDLQAQIEGSDNRISVERRRFNKVVEEYNMLILKFPYSMFGAEKKEYFEVQTKDMEKPKLEF